MRRSNFRRRVWAPAKQAIGLPEVRFHDLRHTAATLAATSGASLKALMGRIGHSSVAAALRYQHVIDGLDAEIVRYLERFDHAPEAPSITADDPSVTAAGGHAEATTLGRPTDSPSRSALTWVVPVEAMGLEPTTPCLQSRCSSQLSYAPGTGRSPAPVGT